MKVLLLILAFAAFLPQVFACSSSELDKCSTKESCEGLNPQGVKPAMFAFNAEKKSCFMVNKAVATDCLEANDSSVRNTASKVGPAELSKEVPTTKAK